MRKVIAACLTVLFCLPAAQAPAALGANALPADNIIWQMATPLQAGAAHTASLASQDPAWYVFTAPSGGAWQFTFTSSVQSQTKGWYIDLLSEGEDGTPSLVISEDYFRPAAQLSYSATGSAAASACIYLRILADNPADFNLLFSFAPDEGPPQEPEPAGNTSPGTALPLQPNAGHTAQLRLQDESHYYFFTLPQAGLFSLSVAGDATAAGSSWAAGLYAAEDGAPALASVYGMQFSAAHTEGAGSVGLPAGSYYLCIRAHYLQSKLSYSLQLAFSPSALWEQEPNNSAAQANPVSFGAEFKGSAAAAADVDWFSFSTEAQGALSVAFNSDAIAEAAWQFDVFEAGEAAGRQLAGHSFAAGAGATGNESALAPGSYYIRVRPASEALAGVAYAFTLSLRPFADVSTVDVAQSRITLVRGKTATVAALARANDDDDPRLLWSSSKPEVVSVDENGRIMAHITGNATITVAAENGVKNSFRVFVVGKPKAVTKLVIRSAPAKITKGKTAQLTPVITPQSATGAVVKWKSSKPSVLSVDATGRITAKSVGTATITLLAGGKRARCEIRVRAPVVSLRLPQKKLSLAVGQSRTLRVALTTADGKGAALKWSSSKPEVAAVSRKGKLTALAPGKTTITVRAENGKKARLTLTVLPPA